MNPFFFNHRFLSILRKQFNGGSYKGKKESKGQTQLDYVCDLENILSRLPKALYKNH